MCKRKSKNQHSFSFLNVLLMMTWGERADQCCYYSMLHALISICTVCPIDVLFKVSECSVAYLKNKHRNTSNIKYSLRIFSLNSEVTQVFFFFNFSSHGLEKGFFLRRFDHRHTHKWKKGNSAVVPVMTPWYREGGSGGFVPVVNSH